MVREIPLTQGHVALVDDDDFPFVNQFKWSVVKTGKHIYARRAVIVDGDWHAIPMHRVIAAAPTGVEVDHWNGNGLDNQRENLRCCSNRQNKANSKGHGKSFKGVSQNRSSHCYAASITISGAPIHLGTYDSAAAAARVFDAAAKRFYGEFSLGNFPEIDPDADAIAARILAGGAPPDRSHMRKVRRLVTDADVIAIRERYASGECQQSQLAAEYGLKTAAICHIITGRTFKGIGVPVTPERRKELHRAHLSGNARSRRLTDAHVTAIRDRYQPHVVTARMLAAEFGVSVPTIYSIVNGYSYRRNAKEAA